MDKRTKSMCLSGLFAAFSAALLYLSGITPAMRISLVVIAGLLTAAALLECGRSFAVLLFAVSSLLGLIVSPVRGSIFIYILFFGYYPIIKSIIERIGKLYLEWVLKFALFNIAFTAAVLLYRAGFLNGIEIPDAALYIIYISANIIFAVYDIGFSKLIFAYLKFRKQLF